MVEIEVHGSHPWKDITLGNLTSNIGGTYGKETKGHILQGSSYIYQKETSARGGYSRSSIFSD